MITPSQESRRTRIQKQEEPFKGLDAVAHSWAGSLRRRWELRANLQKEAAEVVALETLYQELTDEELQERLQGYRDIFRGSDHPEDRLLHHAIAAIREQTDRCLHLRPFDTQVTACLALYRGCLAEMATGEGKTLAAGMAAVLLGWSGKPCHVITVNDYLAQRDAATLQLLYRRCGLQAAAIQGNMDWQKRREVYARDVVYCTAKELVADFLRDRLRLGKLQEADRRQRVFLLQPRIQGLPGVVLRGLHSAIVDEADSVLIDEAVTPVIIAQPRENEAMREAAEAAGELAASMQRDLHYRVNARYREIELLPEGEALAEQAANERKGMWGGARRNREALTQALNARELFEKGRHYAVREGSVHIIDEFTGRIMPQRTWRLGLHQAVEVKEGLKTSPPSETVARLSFQRFFRFFEHLSGMTGTAEEASGEFWQVYHLPVVTLPTHKPCIRSMHRREVYSSMEEKWLRVVDRIVEIHEAGRPILVGTRSVEASQGLSKRLREKGVNHQVLNALNEAEEAQVVQLAGRPGRITIATNMAGRGTDIKLAPGVAEKGGLCVINTELNESARIDRQLYGRSARQGDPGSAQSILSLEDALVTRYIPDYLKRSSGSEKPWLSTLARRLSPLLFHYCQSTAQRIARRQRVQVLQRDHWLEDGLAFAGQEFQS